MRLAIVFTDGMVLQRGVPVRVFGEGRGKVRVDFLGESAELVSEGDAWCIELSPQEYGGPYDMQITLDGELTVLHDIYVGEVWIAAGQSNMEMPLFATEYGFESARRCDNDKVRFFTVPRRTRREEVICGWHFEKQRAEDTPWQICTEDSALHFSAIGFHVATELQSKLGCAVGIISLNWGARRIESFIDRDMMREAPCLSEDMKAWDSFVDGIDMESYMAEYAKAKSALEEMYSSTGDRLKETRSLGVRATTGGVSASCEIPNGPYHPNGMGVLYESMYKRIMPYGIRGILWYQGESNASDRYLDKYLLYMECMKRGFKNTDLDFYAVELASFDISWGAVTRQTVNDRFVTEENWALRREAQQRAAEIAPNNYLVTNMELSDIYEIHPIYKKPLSHRMTLKMLKHTYGFDIYADQPTYRSATFEKNRVTLEFDNAEGLFCCKAVDNVLMYVCDDSHVLKKAKIEEITDGRIVLSCPDVENPTIVRYAFDNYYIGRHIYNKAGLPLAPFRTDK